ncbi:TerB family tellurite resistance protein [Helicobacter baculiformis]|uniref:TerB family tellurite resistance protein n=1 Tax=Helicobacter baculiformis TaxID=427351 RepID=A0ABV7ZHH4_9HELI|nr:TerB family tellurite resistance protein [Helicobacter baculiformis]
MIEVILVVAVAVILLYLYYTLQEYLKNPLHAPAPNAESAETLDLYPLPNPEESLKESESGVVTLLLGRATANMPSSPLKEALIALFLTDLSQNSGIALEKLQEFYNTPNKPDLENLCTQFLEAAHGEYKKRLKLVEFLFVLAYAQGSLEAQSKEMLLDVGAFLRLENADFNALYEGFESLGAHKPYHVILAKMPNSSAFQAQVAQHYLNFLDAKSWHKSYLPHRLSVLWQLQEIYQQGS